MKSGEGGGGRSCDVKCARALYALAGQLVSLCGLSFLSVYGALGRGLAPSVVAGPIGRGG